MKKNIFISIILLTIVALPGCTSAKAQNTVATDSIEINKNINYDIETVATYSSLSLDGAGTKDGFYYINKSENGNQNIMYIDYENKIESYLCNRLECEHKDDTCDSFVTPYGGSVTLFPYENSLYLIYSGAPANMDYFTKFGEDSLSKIVQKDLSGTNTQNIISFPSNEIMIGPPAFDQNHIYIITMSSDIMAEGVQIEYFLKQINIDDGQVIFEEHLDMDYPTIISAEGSKIFLETTYQDSTMQSLHEVESKIFEFDIITKQIVEKKSLLKTTHIFRSIDENLYVIDKVNFALNKINLITGDETVLSSNLEPNSDFGGIMSFSDEGIVYFYFSNGDIGDLKTDFFSFDRNESLNISLPYNVYSESNQGALDIVACSGDEYLVVTSILESNVGFYDTNGEVVKLIGETSKLNFINKNDYFNSINNLMQLN